MNYPIEGTGAKLIIHHSSVSYHVDYQFWWMLIQISVISAVPFSCEVLKYVHQHTHYRARLCLLILWGDAALISVVEHCWISYAISLEHDTSKIS